MKKIKVIHVINNLNIGGAERLLVGLIKELKRSREDIEVVVVSLEGQGPLEKELNKNGIRVKNFNFRLFGPLSRLETYFKPTLIKFIKDENPDIIHGHLLKGEDFAMAAGLFLKIPVINTVHDVMTWPGIVQKSLNRSLYCSVAVSNEVKRHVEKAYNLPASKVVVIPNGIEFTEFKRAKKKFDPSSPVFIYIGRILETKGIDYAIQGLAALRTGYPNLKFLVYGKEVHGSELRKLQKMVGINGYDFVDFMGATDNVPEALSQGDIFVLPSKTEGFALAALEAAAANKPIISTRVGALSEIVTEGKNGFFVEYASSKEITEAASKILLEDVEQFGKFSHDHNQKLFSIEKTAEMYYNLYLKITNEND